MKWDNIKKQQKNQIKQNEEEKKIFKLIKWIYIIWNKSKYKNLTIKNKLIDKKFKLN